MTRLHRAGGFLAISILIRLCFSNPTMILVISVKHNHQLILACTKIFPSLGKTNVVLVSLLGNGSQIGFEAKTSGFFFVVVVVFLFCFLESLLNITKWNSQSICIAYRLLTFAVA